MALIHPDDRESVAAAINQALVSAGSFEVDHRVVRADGSTRYLYGRGGVVSDASGKPTRMVGTVLDISARRKVEDELRRASDYLRTVIEAAPLGIYTLDPAGFVQSWNPAAERLFGWTAQETIGRFLPTVPEDNLLEFMGVRRRVLAGEQITGIELVRRKKDGGWVNVNLFAAPLHDAAGAVTGLLGVVEDVTAAKQLERQFFQAQKMEAVGRLAGGVAHDFNNLLTVILGGCDLLLMDEVSDVKRADLQEIRKAATRAASLTGQLLAVSRQQVLAPQIVDLNVLVAKVESLLRRLLGEDIELLRVAGAELGTIAADPNQLEQVIMTLAVNARDAMPNGGRLTIETANVELDAAFAQSHPPIEPGFYVMIAVRDTGTGLDEHTRAHLFEPFFTTKQRGKGSGLGLSAVYGIVRQSGGSIDASNEPEGGAAIRIYLPWVGGAAADDLLSTEMPASLRGTETVLLVEDDVQVRAITREALTRYGYSVLEAADADGALALEQGNAGPLHLLITDVVLPRRSGSELATLLRARRPDMRVLFMSGYTDDRVSLVREASDSFLQKPFGPETLALKVRETLR